jgi:hypothetical protein
VASGDLSRASVAADGSIDQLMSSWAGAATKASSSRPSVVTTSDGGSSKLPPSITRSITSSPTSQLVAHIDVEDLT